uniref:Serpin B4 n=1 Tax=Jaculus jaculus TaxID=51337 RepID=A0A8C5KHJ7_JACJA
MDSLGEANIKFTIDLFKQLRKPESNVFYSPVSIMSALAMLLPGAAGDTAQQIEEALHVSKDPAKTKGKAAASQVENVHHQFQKLLTKLNKSSDAYDLKIANRIYAEKKFQLLQKYLEDTQKFYRTNVERLDFVNAAEESRKKINSWVESQTDEKIKDLFPMRTLDRQTVLVLVNAVYFKGLWNEKFEKKHTKEEKFWLNKDTSKPVQMMKQTNHFKLAFLEDVQATVLEMPYKGERLSMFVLLPNEVDGLQQLEDKLTAEKLIEWIKPQAMGEREVHLSIPRFKVEENYDLKTVLGHMGIVDAFNPQKADFSGISGGHDLVVSRVRHKSFVEVTEEGTEAAAATGVEISVMSAPIVEYFSCDHPFLFFIKENETNNILFFGRFFSP